MKESSHFNTTSQTMFINYCRLVIQREISFGT